jgi:hypothetical protein
MSIFNYVCLFLFLGVFFFFVSKILKCCSCFCFYAVYCHVIMILLLPCVFIAIVLSLPTTNNICIRGLFLVSQLLFSGICCFIAYKYLTGLSKQAQRKGCYFLHLAKNLCCNNKLAVFTGLLGLANFKMLDEQINAIRGNFEDLNTVMTTARNTWNGQSTDVRQLVTWFLFKVFVD